MVWSVGIIGTNFGSSYHLPAYQKHKQFEVEAISGRKFEKTQKIANSFEIEAIDNWKSMVSDPGIDVISIATPPYLHYEMAKSALENGKHILLEKPTALNGAQAFEIMNLARINSLIGMIAHEWRFYHLNQILYRLIHIENRIGTIEMIRAQDLLPYAYNDRYSWQYNASLGGGWLGIAGSHIIDLIRYLSDTEILDVIGSTGIRTPFRKDNNGKQLTVTAEDYFSTIFTTQNGIHGLVDHIPTLNPAPPSRLIITGSKGTIYSEGSNILIPETIHLANHESVFDKVTINPNPHPIDKEGIKGVMHHLFQLLLDELFYSIKNEEVGNPSLMDGWKNQLVIDAIKESNKKGRKITLKNN